MMIENLVNALEINGQLQRMIDALTTIEDAQKKLAALGMPIDIKM